MPVFRDPTSLYALEHQEYHALRPGFRINEMTISEVQSVPWHHHTHIRDTFYVLEGRLRIFLREPDAEVELGPSDSLVVEPGRPHHVTNAIRTPTTFLVLQGVGEYDFVVADEDA